jgi:Protein of unknown function (DUF998)
MRGALDEDEAAASGESRPWFRLRAAAGIAGPVAFTGAWIASSLRQTGHGFTEVQISGLAAPEARDPWIMIGGFVVLGGCLIAFGSALREGMAGSGGPCRSRPAGPAPRLIQAAGVLTIAAGLLRRDHMLLDTAPGESWHNHAHDVISGVIYLILVAVPLLLARTFRGYPRWRALRRPLVAAAVATAVLLIVFVAQTFRAWDGTLQRVAVSVPLAIMCAVALRLLQTAPRARPRAAARATGW